MNRYKGLQFKGDFRSYQQRVLSNVGKYLKDGKINIVAAPGSGKNILGLELIRKLGEPCLILSPTKDSRDQWGQRLKEYFLGDESQFEELFSTDLHKPKLVNAITYEALYMAVERMKEKADGETSYFDIDFLKTLRRRGINTICLEEPHHLGNDKQKALEKFLECLGEKVMRVCLTAVPPYDLNRTEWSRYYSICGEIDEEIFAPELVAQGDLCPHQDYVYFNYPTAEEMQVIQEHRDFVKKVLEHPHVRSCLKETVDDIVIERRYVIKQTELAWKQFPQEMEALLVLLQYCGMIPDIGKLQKRYKIKRLPEPESIYFQRALQFLVDEGTRFCAAEYVGRLRRVLQENHLYVDRKVTLGLPEETRKNFTFSVGKLKSMGDITLHEYRNMGKDLRLMILTDFNRGSNENLSKIGTNEPYEDISAVSIFETLRRLDDTMNIGVLSGSFMILPKEFVSQGTMVNLEPFEGTRYAKVEVYGTPREGMDLVRELLREGKLQVLIGTNALLEEGWDEPCMNTLILANSVEPFASSNQMRGLVIKSNPQNPEKTANIWHLVTLEPQEVQEEIALEQQSVAKEEELLFGYDYSLVKRRLSTFMTPDYETGNIENGMERLSLIQPPFNEKSVAKKNKGMLELAGNRSKMRKTWKKQLMEAPFQVIEDTAWSIVPCMPVFRYMRKRAVKKIRDYWLEKFAGAIACLFMVIGIMVFCKISKGLGLLIILIDVVVGVLPLLMLHFEPILCKGIGRPPHNWQFLHELSKSGSLGVLETLADNVRKTLAECGLIASDSSVVVEKVGDTINWVRVRLQNATRHDQDIFSKAIGELLAPIGNQRYKLVPKEANPMEKIEYALACPSIIGQKERTAKILEKYLAENLDFIEIVETNRLGGVVFEKYHKYHASMYSAEVPKNAGYLGADTKYIVVKETNTKLLEDKELK